MRTDVAGGNGWLPGAGPGLGWLVAGARGRLSSQGRKLWHRGPASAATSRLQQTIRDPGKPALPRAAAAGEPQPGGAGPCAEGVCGGPERTTGDIEQATGSSSDRKTRRADTVVSAARAEPVPGAWGAGAPGCPSIWEVSGAGDRKGGEASGLVLLSSCPQTVSCLQKFFTQSRRARTPTATYWAVTDGIPATSEGRIQAALKLEYVDDVGLAVPVKSPSRKDLLEGVKRTLSHFRVVATGPGCALVELQPLTVFASQLQVHMVLQLCPMLGDHTYSARVGTVLGQRFLLPAESTKPQKQVLNEALLRHLRLTPAQASQMPLHLHLRCLHLPGPRPRDAPIELLAPLPPYFSRTLQCLGLRQQ
ncbi:mitochondrial mRNA pseudouridine synthase RPUSD3 isoform X2 [Pipistrellus kuhlii]|uniref:mitochondrial mRNA pseudouridine synthase RPUSD3 isoform X2 n=1 Tax=Pipistrellus kuhlii TaxID=59472 RepID=UPI001E26EF49|nr:mitochondrial mRNA pseudouridine synthase RPUSD3 isoform X2 [Pipistrellus kuhlii]